VRRDERLDLLGEAATREFLKKVIMKSLAIGVAAATVALASAPVHANPRALPFTYTTDTLPDGKVELEQFTDLEPLKAGASGSGKLNAWYLPMAFTQELEIGVADRLELGIYLILVPNPADQYTGTARFPGMDSGIAQRLRYILADPGEWPVDVGFYGELTENQNEIEIEAKVLLQRRFDRVRVAANLSAEYEFYFSHEREIVLNPSLGVTYEVNPKLHIGLDSFLRGEYSQTEDEKRTFGLGPHYYLGPAVMANFGRVWWSVGAYARVTDPTHKLQPAEPYGPVYVRSMIGFDL
jgi:hypothetical protein